MRVVIIVLCQLFFTLSVLSQAPAGMLAPEEPGFDGVYAARPLPEVTGKLLNLSPAGLEGLQISYTLVTPFAQRQIKKTTLVQPDGSFRLTLDYPFPFQQIWFGVGDWFYAGLYADSDLFLELDMKKIKEAKEVNFYGEGVRYLGTDGPLNTYMNKYVLFQRKDRQRLLQQIRETIKTASLPTPAQLSTFNLLFDSLKNIQDSYVRANPSPYQWILENERLSEYYSFLSLAYLGNKMEDSIWEQLKQHKSYLVTNNAASYYSYLAMYISDFPGKRALVSWKDLVDAPGLDANEKRVLDSLQENERSTGRADSLNTAGKTAEWIKELQPRLQQMNLLRSLERDIRISDSLLPAAKADFVKFRFNTSTDLNDQKNGFETILSSLQTAWCREVISNQYQIASARVAGINEILSRQESSVSSTAPGQFLLKTDFGGELYRVKEKTAVDFLAALRQNFPGKAIIIDRWATWCQPCLVEMPHSKELQTSAGDLPLIFVYLCTINGSTEAKWKSKVLELKQPGLHFIIDGTMDAEISSLFSFSGYPGYAFISSSGKYLPGALQRISEIKNREGLVDLLKK